MEVRNSRTFPPARLRQVGSNRVKTFTGRPSPVLPSCSRARNFNFVWYCSPAIRIKIPFKGGGHNWNFFLRNTHTHTGTRGKSILRKRICNEFDPKWKSPYERTNPNVSKCVERTFLFFFHASKRISTKISHTQFRIFFIPTKKGSVSNFIHRIKRTKVRFVTPILGNQCLLVPMSLIYFYFAECRNEITAGYVHYNECSGIVFKIVVVKKKKKRERELGCQPSLRLIRPASRSGRGRDLAVCARFFRYHPDLPHSSFAKKLVK